MNRSSPDLGAIINTIRTERGWTLAQMSKQVGIALSTLSKVERGQLTLTYDRLQNLAERLDIPLSELVSWPAAMKDKKVSIPGRRSLGSIDRAMAVHTDSYDYYYLCGDMRKKLMIPMITRIKARSLEEFGELLSHEGEEFIYILEGAVEVHTEFYEPVILKAGESIYIDSSMGHAYLLPEGYKEASLLGITASAAKDLDSLLPTAKQLPHLDGDADQTKRKSAASKTRKTAL